ncbi:MAG: transcription-repair coupling factor [Clostridiales bacterium]|nr:transcription-repair coupling factor [Candidatus Cacconaster stercorequi]
MEHLLREIIQMNEAQELLQYIAQGDCPVSVTGLGPVHRAQMAAALAKSTARPLLMLCSDEKEAARQAADLTLLTGCEAVLVPERERQLRPAVDTSHQWEHRRLQALYCLSQGEGQVVVTTVGALIQRCIPPQVLTRAVQKLAVGMQYDVSALCRQLSAAGYSRCDQVEGPGQYALRGGILDVFSPGMEQPIRCEFFDDEIDSMGVVDPATQRRIYNCKEALLLPAGEVLPACGEGTAQASAQRLEDIIKRLARRENTDALIHTLQSDADALRQGVIPGGCDRYMAAVYPEMTTVLDYLPPDTLVCVSESGRVSETLKAALWQVKEDVSAAMEDGHLSGELAALTLSDGELAQRLSQMTVIQMESLPTSRFLLPPRTLLQISAKQLSSYGGSLETAATDMTHYLTAGYRCVVLCGGEVRARNMRRLLHDKKISAVLDLTGEKAPERGSVLISLGALSAGSEYPALRLAILTEGQLTAPVSGKVKKPRRVKDSSRQKLQSYTDLTPGDLVVHTHHGIGRFVGIIRMPVDGVEKDYIKIAYAGSDCLYVPATSLDLVSKYIGSGGEDSEKPVKLHKLGGTEWAKATYRAKKAAKDLAKGLIELYAQRQRQEGFAFSPDSPWQQEFEDAFDYEETDDQLTAIREIKHDMERPVPMDRLLCGDVGYGKTEVALRAVMKCILDGKQAAILVPTTVLAQQHYATAMSRFRSFPVNIEVLSRFRTPKQVKEILQRTQEGKIDLLIGTHKLLQKNVTFKDLGLLIIDEEQRFGVTHKEKLRERVRQVDTLTLSATPIPRTLNMALSGIRDMSTIEQPPQDRQPVQTYVLEHDWSILGDAMRREISRGGQIYYLHNRVENIESTAGRLHQMLGEDVSIGIAHGKMSERDLSRVMQQMSDGELQVLVCTTIIETGIDIPNVNTLIIEDADRMGLSQLHQIRGRIGRSSRRAYAYLTYRTGKILSEVANKRLTAIREYVAFGSGFRIAMRDLEIRGAGNLLGPEQSGYMMSVGYDMYLKLLNDAVLEEQGKSAEIRTDCSADITVSAHIPERYVSSAAQRMDLYRRIAAIRTTDDSADLLDEMMDRYGDPPKSVLALLDVALLRAAAAQVGISDITQRGSQIVFSFQETIDLPALMTVCAMPSYRSRLLLSAGEHPHLTLRLSPRDNVLQAASSLIEELRLNQMNAGDPAGEGGNL